jgi:hypothetical protein
VKPAAKAAGFLFPANVARLEIVRYTTPCRAGSASFISYSDIAGFAVSSIDSAIGRNSNFDLVAAKPTNFEIVKFLDDEKRRIIKRYEIPIRRKKNRLGVVRGRGATVAMKQNCDIAAIRRKNATKNVSAALAQPEAIISDDAKHDKRGNSAQKEYHTAISL